MKCQIEEDLLGERAHRLQRNNRICRAVVDDGGRSDRCGGGIGKSGPRERWRQQQQHCHLVRAFAGEERAHQPAEAGANDAPAGGIGDDRPQLRHALLQGAAEIRGDDVGEVVAQQACLEALTAPL
jgi:hypothetical protein